MLLKEQLRMFLQKLIADKRTVDYVCGNGEALPLPLSAQEESEMLKKLSQERSGAGCRYSAALPGIPAHPTAL